MTDIIKVSLAARCDVCLCNLTGVTETHLAKHVANTRCNLTGFTETHLTKHVANTRCNLTGFTETHLAKHVANTDSCTCGPHRGSSPLHLVLAFCRAALSHSSRPRACLHTKQTQTSTNKTKHVFIKKKSQIFRLQYNIIIEQLRN